jgi:hypothetical protein
MKGFLYTISMTNVDEFLNIVHLGGSIELFVTKEKAG